MVEDEELLPIATPIRSWSLLADADDKPISLPFVDAEARCCASHAEFSSALIGKDDPNSLSLIRTSYG